MASFNVKTEIEYAGMIIAHWAPWFKKLYGGVLPDDYLGFDLETCGWDRQRDVIVEWGHCMVRDRKCVDRNSVLINWFSAPETIPSDYLESQLLRVQRQMSLNNRPWHITPQRLRDEGVHPEKALNFIYDLVTEIRDQKMMFVSHNGWNFDYQMLVRGLKDIGQDFVLGPNQMLDTGAIEKATQLISTSNRALPQPGETLMKYFKRVQAWRAAGVNWNLDTHCVKKYGLDTKYGIDPKKLHSAGEDAYVLHLLMEEFRGLAERTVVARAASHLPLPSAASVRSVQQMAEGRRAVAPATAQTPTYRGQRNR